MILSRVWYFVLALAAAMSLCVVYIAAGQYDRQAARALTEGLASDSQTVEWALKIDARHRLDALLPGSVDATLQQALIAANGTREGKVPEAAKASAKKALSSVNDAIPADWRDDALFAVDRDGQVVASLGFDQVQGNDDFELGGYPAVNDALHGWLRDDVWLLGSKMYVVVARPVEYDTNQRPAGAIVGLKEISPRFVSDLAKRTRTSLVFYVGGTRVAGGVGVDGFDEEKLDSVAADLSKVDDSTYGEGFRSHTRLLTDDLGALYARLPGDVWLHGGGFAVARAKTPLTGPMGFITNFDEKDRANLPLLLLIGVVLLGGLLGIGLTLIEHTLPLRELVMQAERLRIGAIDGLSVARFRGAYRLAAQALNQGMDLAIQKAGGVTRKPADLESIIGPVPAQPSMSAFSFPMSDGGSAPQMQPTPTPYVPYPAPSAPLAPPPAVVGQFTPPMGAPAAAFPPPGPPPAAPPPAQRPPPPAAPRVAPPPAPPPQPPVAGPPKPPPPIAAAVVRPPAPPPAPPPALLPLDEDDDATMVGSVPAELLAQATGEHNAMEDTAQWLAVYEDFIRTKKQCGEPTDGLTFEKFSHTLKKNRDALITRHGCKRVKFSVYVKEGRASLKATPVKD